ncbi:hypothetical protein AMK22_12220 [Streptomyces sp. CB01580]|nr:hypothetical protein AMK22_12220 [Streptomyces sp. CB01580]
MTVAAPESTAATGSTPWSGTSARSPGLSPRTASPRGVEPRQAQGEDERYETFARILDRDGVQRHRPDVRGY